MDHTLISDSNSILPSVLKTNSFLYSATSGERYRAITALLLKQILVIIYI